MADPGHPYPAPLETVFWRDGLVLSDNPGSPRTSGKRHLCRHLPKKLHAEYADLSPAAHPARCGPDLFVPAIPLHAPDLHSGRSFDVRPRASPDVVSTHAAAPSSR